MCIAAIAWQWSRGRSLVIATNRDEFYHRASAALHEWPQGGVFAGRDLALDEDGTWLGISRNGRFALLTNVRNPAEVRPDAPSRGPLAAQYLKGEQTPADYIAQIAARRQRYNGFNLIVGDTAIGREDCWFLHSRDAAPQRLAPGLYGLSNAALDTPWPKVQKLAGRFAVELIQHRALPAMLDLLRDNTPASDSDLPQTGIALEWERALSPIFIATERYGTRASTVLEVAGQHATMIERRYPPDCASDEPYADKQVTFEIQPTAKVGNKAGTLPA
jgi:uncharacterized protein with NRDE domain